MLRDHFNKTRTTITPPMGLLHVTGKAVLAVLVAAMLAIPFAERSAYAVTIEASLISVIVLVSVLAVSGRRRSLLIATTFGGLAVAARWLHAAAPQNCPAEVYLVFAALTVAYAARRFVGHIMTARRVDGDVLCTAVAAFLLLGIVWSLVYQIIDRQFPGSFVYTASSAGPQPAMRGEFALYFSIVTLCTVGFGDVVPASHIARMAAMLEGVTGVFYVAVLVSRLVSLYTAAQQADTASEP